MHKDDENRLRHMLDAARETRSFAQGQSRADERHSRIKSAAGAGLTVTLRVGDADVAHSLLEGAGLKVGPVRTHPWGARLFRFHDSEGHRLEVWSPCG